MKSTKHSGPNWYAVYTKPHFERKIFQALDRSNFHVFLPLIKEKRVWSDRIKTVKVPLLPNYLFVKIHEHETKSIFDFPGVVRYVSSEGKPSVIKEKDIEYLEKIVNNGFKARNTCILDVGEEVRITRGPLVGCEGRLLKKLGKTRIVLQISAIPRAISVEVQASDIEKIGTPCKSGVTSY